jgi:hypothetical protein
VYIVVLTKLDGPKSITPQRGPNAGQTVVVYDWTFEILDGDYAGTELRGTTSAASGPRSKMYSWLTALMGGTPPAEGTVFTEDSLLGQACLATILRDDSGWPKIEQLAGLPAHMQPGNVFAQQMGLPGQPTQQAVPQQAPTAPTAPRSAPVNPVRQSGARPAPAGQQGGYSRPTGPVTQQAQQPPADDLPF